MNKSPERPGHLICRHAAVIGIVVQLQVVVRRSYISLSVGPQGETAYLLVPRLVVVVSGIVVGKHPTDLTAACAELALHICQGAVAAPSLRRAAHYALEAVAVHHSLRGDALHLDAVHTLGKASILNSA